MPKIIPLSEAASFDRLRNGLRRGFTRAYAEKTLAERRAWMLEMIAAGASDAEIKAATGLLAKAVAAQRKMAEEISARPPVLEPIQALPEPITPIARQPRRPRPELDPIEDDRGEASEAGIKLDSGSYMRAVRRLGVPPPPSWRFGRDMTPLLSRPVVIRSTSSAGWCADEGEAHTAISDL